MAGQPKRRAPQLARTDFESMTHEQLAAMLDPATSEGAAQLATKLSKAASTITKIGDDLMTYTKGLEWQGEAGDAFRDWGGQTASATLRLGQYAEVASRWMATVAQAVAEAKAAMPDPSETTRAEEDLAEAKKTMAAAQAPGARNDPDARKLAQTAQSDAAAAQQRMEAARTEAVQQLRKLAQTYEYSAQQVNSVEPPTFSPPVANTGDPSWWREPQKKYLPDGSAWGGEAALAFTRQPVYGDTAAGQVAVRPVAYAVTEHGTTGLTDQQVPHAQPVAMEIDGLATLPRFSEPLTAASAGPQTNLPRPDTSHIQSSVAPPAFNGSVGIRQGPVNPAHVPSATRSPLVPGQGLLSGGPVRTPRDTGIVGGRPVTPVSGRPTGGIPHGTVIGSGGVQGHTPMPRDMVTGPTAGGTSGTAGGPTGRRPSSETGGVVGARPIQSGHTGARPFTPGGSGLVRPGASGVSAHGPVAGRGTPLSPTNPSNSRREEQRGQRPDYLLEEEETWVRQNRRALPPVVD
ncbi:hypothetical protein [Streptomyces glaucus]|uniref:PPE family domain-containing protein n=1 Tax=Streptomyces glaucus TaxID=284029 RepID=A0ABN3KFF2_9ACTN